jgi:hypothetical protein
MPRALLVFVCLVFAGVPAMAGPFPGSDEYKAHLEFLGYTVTDGEASLIARHDTNYNISVKSYNGGVLVVTFFGTTSKAKRDRVGFLEFLNGMNAGSVAARYYEDNEGDVIVEGWYPGAYDRANFGVFIEKFNLIGEELGGSDTAADYLE